MTTTNVQDLVATAIQTELNSDPKTDFGIGFTAERSGGDWNAELNDFEKLHVDVIGAGYKSIELADSSGSIRYVVETQIAVRERVRKNPDKDRIPMDVIEPLRDLVEKIAAHFVTLELPTYTAAAWQPTEGNRPIEVAGDATHLRELHQFSGVIRLAHEVIK